MSNASTVMDSPAIRLPYVAIPKFRWPRLSRRAPALLMMALMVSPCFLWDAIEYCVKRVFYTADQVAEMRASEAMLTHFRIFHVACPDTDAPVVEQSRWAAYAAQHGWPLYPQAGAACVNPDRDLRGVIGLKVFNVACPAIAFSAADQRRWVAYAADHDWGPYPQAGAGCVDP